MKIGLMALALLVSAVRPSWADTTTTLNAVDSGFYGQDASHQTGNYAAGWYAGSSSSNVELRDYFIFDLSTVSSTVVSAFLRLSTAPSGSIVYGSSDPSETYTLFDVSTDLVALANGSGGVPAYSDLGSGVSYGSVHATSTLGSTVEIPLNAAGVAFLAANRGQIGIGGAITTLAKGSASEFLFNATNASLTRQLVITTAPPAANYQGLWWNAQESGWGINFAHQGDIIFATWFTYGADNKPQWYTIRADKTATNVYAGAVSSFTGPPFNSVPFPANANLKTPVGTATFTFAEDGRSAAFAYTVNGIAQTRQITPQEFSSPVPTCVWGAQPDLTLATNYQDLWWVTNGDEAGWGINFTHQGKVIFATWFTYDLNGKGWWLFAVATETAVPKVYSGLVKTAAGPSFNAQPWDPNAVARTTVGDATITVIDGNHARFDYTVNGVAQSKNLVRQVFVPPGTVCSSPPVPTATVEEDSWTGTGSSTSAAISATAEVTWTLESTVNNVATYRPTGSASVVVHGCLTYNPSSGTIDPFGGVLFVDYNTNPATYHGSAVTQWPAIATVTCPNPPPPFSTLAAAAFFGGSNGIPGVEAQGLVGSDGVTIEGSDTNTSGEVPVTFSWKFTRNR